MFFCRTNYHFIISSSDIDECRLSEEALQPIQSNMIDKNSVKVEDTKLEGSGSRRYSDDEDIVDGACGKFKSCINTVGSYFCADD